MQTSNNTGQSNGGRNIEFRPRACYSKFGSRVQAHALPCIAERDFGKFVFRQSRHAFRPIRWKFILPPPKIPFEQRQHSGKLVPSGRGEVCTGFRQYQQTCAFTC